MNCSLLGYALLAQISRWQRLGDGIHRGRGGMDLAEFLPVVLAIAVIAIGIAVVVMLKKRNDFSQSCDDPQRLFRELSVAHELDRASQNLLWQLVDTFQLAQPAQVFLQPALFDVNKLPEQLRDEADRIAELKSRLF